MTRGFATVLASILIVSVQPALLADEGTYADVDAMLERALRLERTAEETARRPLEAADVRCGTWHSIGPFKDAEHGVFAREFEAVFAPERDVLAAGSLPAPLEETYRSVPVVGAPDGSRKWTAHPEWVDGYHHQLASGPPPGRNEATYLYRTIVCASAVEAEACLVTLDAAKAWLDGKAVLDAPIRPGEGQRFLEARFRMPLKAGENRLLVKIVKCFHRNGFSFAIDGLHPLHPIVSRRQRAGTALEPYASALRQRGRDPKDADPPWYVRKGAWPETLLASREAAAAGRPPGLPLRSPILRQADGARHVRIDVSGLRTLALFCTVGGDDYGYDDTIWADPKLIAKDGTETWLVDLKPTEARVGFLELFVNRNYAGKRLKIGDREFERGFWAHAPSALIFDLGGKYDWFETWFGLDALAVQSGSSEFIVDDRADAASPDALEARLAALLVRDAPDGDTRREIERELTDRIWDAVRSPEEVDLLRERYAAAAMRALGLSADPAVALPSGRGADGLRSMRDAYHRAKRLAESMDKVRRFRLEAAPFPTYDPPVLEMQRALDAMSPTPGGAAYLARLEPVRERVRAAATLSAAGRPGAAEATIGAAEAIEMLEEESIRAVGPIAFVRHPSFGRINAVDPYDAPGRGPASIAVFDPARPDDPPRVIYDDPQGCVWQASPSYDGRTIFFAARRAGVPGGWHIYEVGVDGGDFRRITDGDSSDISPVELPGGQILFVSNRAGNMNVCQPNRAGVLYICERDGSRVRRVSANTLSDHTPAVMDDGRVLFTRWDYGVDKGVFQRHGVWTMNPDGTQLRFFFGNTVLDPNAFWQCVPVPGRPEVISTFGGHHAGPYGVPGLLWNGLGAEAPRGGGFRFLVPEHPTYFDGNFQDGWVDPHPLDEHEYLVAYGGDGGGKSRLYLLDSRGNRTCIWEEAGDLGCYSPFDLRPHKRPPVIPLSPVPEFRFVDPVEAGLRPDDATRGTFVLEDVHTGLEGRVSRGEIRALQILELVPKTRPHTGGYAWNISPLVGRGTFYVRRLIGTVPVEEDGSSHFTAPALRDISFNALDAEGRVIHKMGSTTQAMPGDAQGCQGCHAYERPPRPGGPSLPAAARRPPSDPERPDWGTGGLIDYVRVVQPVWDRHCVECHGGPRPDGDLDLSGDTTRYFNMSYDMLIDRDLVHHVPQNGADQDLTTPRANGSLVSRLVTGGYLDPGHRGVALSPEERRRVYTWIDANVPYYATYLYTDGSVNGARCRWYDDQPDGWFRKELAPVFLRRCLPCHQRTVDISDAWLGRRTVTVSSKRWSDIAIMSQGLGIEDAVATFGPEHRINLTHPEWSQMLTAPLARAAGGLGSCRDEEGGPIFADADDPDYRALLEALRHGAEALRTHPRVDMLPAESTRLDAQTP